MLVSYQDYQQETQGLSYAAAKFISTHHGLRGQEAAESMRRHLAGMSTLAEQEGLTPEDIGRMASDEG